jgi:hypothetical protein
MAAENSISLTMFEALSSLIFIGVSPWFRLDQPGRAPCSQQAPRKAIAYNDPGSIARPAFLAEHLSHHGSLAARLANRSPHALAGRIDSSGGLL